MHYISVYAILPDYDKTVPVTSMVKKVYFLFSVNYGIYAKENFPFKTYKTIFSLKNYVVDTFARNIHSPFGKVKVKNIPRSSDIYF